MHGHGVVYCERPRGQNCEKLLGKKEASADGAAGD